MRSSVKSGGKAGEWRAAGCVSPKSSFPPQSQARTLVRLGPGVCSPPWMLDPRGYPCSQRSGVVALPPPCCASGARPSASAPGSVVERAPGAAFYSDKSSYTKRCCCLPWRRTWRVTGLQLWDDHPQKPGIRNRSLGMNLQLSSPFSSHITWGF